jgi:hypothetical protein
MNERHRVVMIPQGKFSFRTCFRQAFIPASYLLNLTRQSYSGDSEPKTLQDAVNHWLLIEILGAIGGHTVA